jgi:hypothetical protein
LEPHRERAALLLLVAAVAGYDFHAMDVALQALHPITFPQLLGIKECRRRSTRPQGLNPRSQHISRFFCENRHLPTLKSIEESNHEANVVLNRSQIMTYPVAVQKFLCTKPKTNDLFVGSSWYVSPKKT